MAAMGSESLPTHSSSPSHAPRVESAAAASDGRTADGLRLQLSSGESCASSLPLAPVCAESLLEPLPSSRMSCGGVWQRRAAWAARPGAREGPRSEESTGMAARGVGVCFDNRDASWPFLQRAAQRPATAPKAAMNLSRLQAASNSGN